MLSRRTPRARASETMLLTLTDVATSVFFVAMAVSRQFDYRDEATPLSLTHSAPPTLKPLTHSAS